LRSSWFQKSGVNVESISQRFGAAQLIACIMVFVSVCTEGRQGPRALFLSFRCSGWGYAIARFLYVENPDNNGGNSSVVQRVAQHVNPARSRRCGGYAVLVNLGSGSKLAEIHGGIGLVLL
jgi:hypothetical protein